MTSECNTTAESLRRINTNEASKFGVLNRELHGESITPAGLISDR